jgi:hypothetical protein
MAVFIAVAASATMPGIWLKTGTIFNQIHSLISRLR